MGKPTPDTNETNIRDAQERALGVQNLQWRVSRSAKYTFCSLLQFAKLPPYDPRVATYIPQNCIGYMIGDEIIPVMLDESQPLFMCQLVGDDFEATLELEPYTFNETYTE